MVSSLARVVFASLVGVLLALVIVYTEAREIFSGVVAVIWFLAGAAYLHRGEARIFFGVAALALGGLGVMGLPARELVAATTIVVAGAALASVIRDDLLRLLRG
jgi:hypothetical protein